MPKGEEPANATSDSANGSTANRIGKGDDDDLRW